ncbi:MAG: hypothetical protein PHG69_06615 [Candidatus Omnitrophica bacterium]|nr:hypothetical protein [Candidatus Omnitrophota bacterium]
MKLIKYLTIFVFLVGVSLLTALPSFATDVKIVDYNYLTHWNPGAVPSFSVGVRNNDNIINDVYISIILTNLATSKEVAPYPSSAATLISAGRTSTLAATVNPWTATAGIFTVTIILYRSSDDLELDRKYGSEPIHVGMAMDSVAAFPRVLDLGTLQYGRFMHPVPIEINWNFYLASSQIRKDQPWYMRIYTDNHNKYQGIEGAIYSGRIATQEGGDASALGSPAGLVSSDRKYVLPLKVWCLNFGPDVEEGWDPNLLGPPPVKEDYYWKGPLLDTGRRDAQRVAWQWVPDYIDMNANNASWRKLIGQDPFDTHYASDSNPTGDFTLTSPFQVFIAYETSPTAVVGKYSTDLIIEIYTP